MPCFPRTMPELRIGGAVFTPRFSYRDCRYIISGLGGGQGPASQVGEFSWRCSLTVPTIWRNRDSRWSAAIPRLEKRETWATRSSGMEQLAWEMFSMWSILWNRFHICRSFKSCSTKSCYTLPTKPRSALGETGPLWCAMLCGNISTG